MNTGLIPRTFSRIRCSLWTGHQYIGGMCTECGKTIPTSKITDDEYVICRKAIKTFGKEHQMQKAIEECSELIDALIKFGDARCTENDVITEIADVQVVTDQLAIIFGEDAVAEEKKFKLDRLERRMTNI